MADLTMYGGISDPTKQYAISTILWKMCHRHIVHAPQDCPLLNAAVEAANIIVPIAAEAQREADVAFVQEYGGAQDVTVCGQALSSQPLITGEAVAFDEEALCPACGQPHGAWAYVPHECTGLHAPDCLGDGCMGCTGRQVTDGASS